MNYKLSTTLTLLLLCSYLHVVSAQKQSKPYLDYIDKYASLAVAEQKKYRIPASITLAQGLLESGAGNSELALKSNNHFGIKCHNDWTGGRVYHNDDTSGECFRKYTRVADSYNDHSLFLTGRSRYALLFELRPTDYKGWAHGLQKAGYATDPQYARKLIKLIEEYGLHQYDKADSKAIAQQSEKGGSVSASQTAVIAAIASHQILKNNGLKYVLAEAGDTFESIGKEFGISAKSIRRYNEAPTNLQPTEGSFIYLQKKKKVADKQHTIHVVQGGESAWEIAQRYGIQVKQLYDLNGMDYAQGVAEKQTLQLR